MDTHITRSRVAWDFVLILLTAAFTGTGAWFVSQYQLSKQQEFWIQQQRMLGEGKLHESKLAYLERTERLQSNFRSTSMIYFIADVAQKEGASIPDRETKHTAFHALESEMRSCLLIVQFFFREEVGKAVDDLNRYFNSYSWENLIQTPEFVAKTAAADRRHSAGDTISKLVSKEIHLDEYDRLTDALITAMARDISSDFNTR